MDPKFDEVFVPESPVAPLIDYTYLSSLPKTPCLGLRVPSAIQANASLGDNDDADTDQNLCETPSSPIILDLSQANTSGRFSPLDLGAFARQDKPNNTRPIIGQANSKNNGSPISRMKIKTPAGQLVLGDDNQKELKILEEMFPETKSEILAKALVNRSVSEAVEFVLAGSRKRNSIISVSSDIERADTNVYESSALGNDTDSAGISKEDSPVVKRLKTKKRPLFIQESPTFVCNNSEIFDVDSGSSIKQPRKGIVISDDEQEPDLQVIKNESEPVIEIVESAEYEEHASSEELAVLELLNNGSSRDLISKLKTDNEMAARIIELRPFPTWPSVSESNNSKTFRIIKKYLALLCVYSDLDGLILSCDLVGSEMKTLLGEWESGQSTSKSFSLLRKQPATINPDLQLKGYQLIGVSWLNALYRKELGGILADQMYAFLIPGG